MTVIDGKVVLMHYTLTNDNGETLDSSEGRDPLGFIQGSGQIIPGLEKALEGMKSGEKVNVTVTPEEGYGRRSEEMVQIVPKTQFEQPDEVKVGIQFQIQTPQGVNMAQVTAVEGDDVTIDMNHPLADQTLYFDVEIVEVRDASEEETSHGHVHGVGGHQH